MITFRDIKPNGFVDLWYLGPPKPVPPSSPGPEPCDADSLKPENIVVYGAWQDACERYRTAMAQYRREVREYEQFRTEVGGPIRCELWPVHARMVLERQADGQIPERYFKALPAGQKPGTKEKERQRQREAEERERERAIRFDPHFGESERASDPEIDIARR